MLSRAFALSCRSYAWQRTRSTMSRVIIKRLSQYGEMYNTITSTWSVGMYLTPDSAWRIFYHAHVSAFCMFVFGSLKLFNEFSKSEAATQRPYPSLRLLLQRFILKRGFFKIFVDLSANNKRISFFQILTLVFVISRITDNEYNEYVKFTRTSP